MQPSLDFTAAIKDRDLAIARVSQHAEDAHPGFLEQAKAFIVAYLAVHGPTPGEVLTLACKAAGIRSHDDRAFGAVYLGLARAGRIVQVGSVRRARGHGTQGGSIWDLSR